MSTNTLLVLAAGVLVAWALYQRQTGACCGDCARKKDALGFDTPAAAAASSASTTPPDKDATGGASTDEMVAMGREGTSILTWVKAAVR